MRVLVVGGTGNVGERLVALLASDPQVERVVSAARRMPASYPDGVELRRVDLAEGVPASLLDRIDAVVHLAWLFQPTHTPHTTWRANVEGTIRLLDAVARSGVTTFVQASSVGAYSGHLPRDPVDEGWPTNGVPTAAYSREKAYVERLLDVFERDHAGVRVVRIRPAFIFRRESAVEQRRLFGGPLVPGRLVARHPPPLLPDPGGLQFQALHTSDVAEAYRLALVNEVRGAFNLAAEPVLDLPVIAEQLGARVVRVPPRLARTALSAAWAAHLLPAEPGLFDLLREAPLLRTDRAREVLGWEPRHSSIEAFHALLDGLASGRGGPTPPLSPDTSGPGRSHELGTGIGEQP